MAEAHAAGLLVHPWTFRPEPAFLPAGLDADAELDAFLALGVDGVFADDPGAAVAAVAGRVAPGSGRVLHWLYGRRLE